MKKGVICSLDNFLPSNLSKLRHYWFSNQGYFWNDSFKNWILTYLVNFCRAHVLVPVVQMVWIVSIKLPFWVILGSKLLLYILSKNNFKNFHSQSKNHNCILPSLYYSYNLKQEAKSLQSLFLQKCLSESWWRVWWSSLSPHFFIT